MFNFLGEISHWHHACRLRIVKGGVFNLYFPSFLSLSHLLHRCPITLSVFYVLTCVYQRRQERASGALIGSCGYKSFQSAQTDICPERSISGRVLRAVSHCWLDNLVPFQLLGVGGRVRGTEQVPFVPWHFQLAAEAKVAVKLRRGWALTSLRASAGGQTHRLVVDNKHSWTTQHDSRRPRGYCVEAIPRPHTHPPLLGPAPGEPVQSLRTVIQRTFPVAWLSVIALHKKLCGGPLWGKVAGREASLFQQPPPAVGLKLQVFFPPWLSTMIGRWPQDLCFKLERGEKSTQKAEEKHVNSKPLITDRRNIWLGRVQAQ